MNNLNFNYLFSIKLRIKKIIKNIAKLKDLVRMIEEKKDPAQQNKQGWIGFALYQAI